MSKLNEWLAYFELKKEIIDKQSRGFGTSTTSQKQCRNTNPHRIVRTPQGFIHPE